MESEVKAAYELVRKERADRLAQFQAELQSLCDKYRVNLSEGKIAILDPEEPITGD